MDVLALRERVEQPGILRDVRHDAQLDLRVIGRHDPVARRRDERLADAAALGGADRDVLQVRVGRRQTPGDSDRLAIGGVHAPVGIGTRRQLVAVRRLQLRQPPVLEQHLRQRVVLGQLFQHFLVGRRRAARRLLDDRQLQLPEQDLADLLRAAEVERLTRQFGRLPFEFGDAPGEFGALRFQLRAVDQHAGALHFEQHLRDRQFDVLVDRAQLLVRLDVRPQRVMQRQRDLGILGGVLGGAIERDLVETQLVRTLAADLGERDGLAPEVAFGQRVHVVAAMRLDDVGLEQRVVRHAGELQPVVGEHMHVVLQVLPHLAMVRALQPRTQRRERRLERELFRHAGVAVRQRDVTGPQRLDRQRQARPGAPPSDRATSSRCRRRSARRRRCAAARHRAVRASGPFRTPAEARRRPRAPQAPRRSGGSDSATWPTSRSHDLNS